MKAPSLPQKPTELTELDSGHPRDLLAWSFLKKEPQKPLREREKRERERERERERTLSSERLFTMLSKFGCAISFF